MLNSWHHIGPACLFGRAGSKCFSAYRRWEMRTGWPWTPSGISAFHVIFRQPRVWPPSRRCILSDTCNNSVNGRKIELTLKADSSRSWELKVQWPVAAPSPCFARRDVCNQRESPAQITVFNQSGGGGWRGNDMYIIVSATHPGPLSACMHITCVKAARDMAKETESHHRAATQGVFWVEVGLRRGVWSLLV